MKTLGLLGGMSWESTVLYYRLLNTHIRNRKGALHSCPLILHSFDFAPIATLQHSADWPALQSQLAQAAAGLHAAGAEAIVLCTNTMHFVAEGIESEAGIPLLHIVDATAEAAKKEGIKRVGLLGTRFTMEKEFYAGRMQDMHSLEVVVPAEAGRGIVHDIIYDELCNGIVRRESRERLLEVVAELKAAGAKCLVLGCTELVILVGEGEEAERACGMKVLDTTRLHAEAAAEWAMGED